jgi:FkbM family methyltransferase
LYVYDSSYINSLVPNAPYSVRFDQHASSISVECTTVDLFCVERNIKKIDVLKIDTEGFDLEVLKGAAAMRAMQKGQTGMGLLPMVGFQIPQHESVGAISADY